ncbi:hypothetical protein [Lentzea kentuckyensis]|uniref:hypothetical protein n=1 Tax=Lentzea kentuckyensis TaxID=360086 RepID=UPI0013026F3F|nr:hypothetical protein [Lentzea kentuckyensis]
MAALKRALKSRSRTELEEFTEDMAEHLTPDDHSDLGRELHDGLVVALPHRHVR